MDRSILVTFLAVILAIYRVSRSPPRCLPMSVSQACIRGIPHAFLTAVTQQSLLPCLRCTGLITQIYPACCCCC